MTSERHAVIGAGIVGLPALKLRLAEAIVSIRLAR